VWIHGKISVDRPYQLVVEVAGTQFRTLQLGFVMDSVVVLSSAARITRALILMQVTWLCSARLVIIR
jgi:hypothetical protein